MPVVQMKNIRNGNSPGLERMTNRQAEQGKFMCISGKRPPLIVTVDHPFSAGGEQGMLHKPVFHFGRLTGDCYLVQIHLLQRTAKLNAQAVLEFSSRQF